MTRGGDEPVPPLELPRPPVPRSAFRRVVELNAALDVVVADASRRAALAGVLADVDADLPAGIGTALGRLPGHVGAHMGRFGWVWNGIYVLQEDGTLRLGPACGPPVCETLEVAGEPAGGGAAPLSSGMCFDALALNQTLSGYDAQAWPGYVSCDATSGLSTRAGIVAPLRGPDARPVAVWDLDSTEPIEPGDVRFFDVLTATLARTVWITRAAFAA